MPKNYPDWLSLLQKKDLPPVIALSGDERAFVDEALAEIKSRVLSGGMSDFNLDVTNGKTDSMGAILSRANTLPMMAPLRLVLVKDAESIKSDDVSGLEAYLNAPSQTSVLVFLFNTIDIRQKLPKLLDAHLFKFDHPRDDQMPALIKKRAQRHGLSIHDEAASALWMEIGTDLLMLERALEKLALVCTDQAVTTEIIMNQVAQTRLVDAFGLGRAVAIANQTQAIQYMGKLRTAQEIPLKLVGMLAWQLRQVLKVRLCLDDGQNENQIGQNLHLYGDRLRPVVTAAKKWRTEFHIARLLQLTQLDRELKRSRAPAWLWFERVVMQLCED